MSLILKKEVEVSATRARPKASACVRYFWRSGVSTWISHERCWPWLPWFHQGMFTFTATQASRPHGHATARFRDSDRRFSP